MTIKTNWSCKDTVFPFYSCSHIIFLIDSVWLSRRKGTILRCRPVTRREWAYAHISSPQKIFPFYSRRGGQRPG